MRILTMENVKCPRCGNIFTTEEIMNDIFKCYSCGQLINKDRLLKNGEFIYKLSDCGTYYIIIDKGDADSKKIVIPEFYNSLPVRKIAKLAFEGSIMEKLIISANLKEIEEKSFLNCYNLKKIIVNKKNRIFDSRKHCNGIVLSKKNEVILGCKNTKLVSSIKSIGKSSFRRCLGLKRMKIPKNIVEIKPYAFSSCINLTSISISKTINKISTGSFSYCKFKNLKINNKITKIDAYAFYSCKNLEYIKLSENLKIIYQYAFANCNNLKSIQLPNKLKKIRYGAFSNCQALKTLTIPKSVRIVEEGSFRNCNNLKDVISYTNGANIDHAAFDYDVKIEIYSEE